MKNVIDFSGRKITLVLCTIDLRAGFASLAAVASSALNINIYAGKDAVVFVARTRAVCKVILADKKGCTLITRRLHSGRFQQLMAMVNESSQKTLTATQLQDFLNGYPLMKVPASVFEET